MQMFKSPLTICESMEDIHNYKKKVERAEERGEGTQIIIERWRYGADTGICQPQNCARDRGSVKK